VAANIIDGDGRGISRTQNLVDFIPPPNPSNFFFGRYVVCISRYCAFLRLLRVFDLRCNVACPRGALPPPLSTDPLELIIWENIAYLANDSRRAEAFAMSSELSVHARTRFLLLNTLLWRSPSFKGARNPSCCNAKAACGNGLGSSAVVPSVALGIRNRMRSREST
jgi:hypothetical protein